jgi:endonuclease YncB( thermonuclease family)
VRGQRRQPHCQFPQHRGFVRLAGIDPPEKKQPFGNASRKNLRELVAGKEVSVGFEKYDRYGRIVGKVWVTPPDCPSCDNTLDAGLEQIISGMDWWYGKYAHEQSAGDQKRYEFSEQEAKEKKVGLWQERIQFLRGSSGMPTGNVT